VNDDNKLQVSDEAIDLLDRLLQYDHQARPTAAEAMQHPWFTTIRQMEYYNVNLPTSIKDYKDSKEQTSSAAGSSSSTALTISSSSGSSSSSSAPSKQAKRTEDEVEEATRKGSEKKP